MTWSVRSSSQVSAYLLAQAKRVRSRLYGTVSVSQLVSGRPSYQTCSVVPRFIPKHPTYTISMEHYDTKNIMTADVKSQTVLLLPHYTNLKYRFVRRICYTAILSVCDTYKRLSQLKQEAPLTRRAQRVRHAYWCTLCHFSGENLLMANLPLLRNWPRKLPISAK